MARKYANILTAIWRNEEFRALSGEEQRVYLLLATQADISAAGVLHLSVTRWADMARDTTPAAVMTALNGLARGRFVIFDTRTEELLVRSFVRWDGGHTNSKRRPVIRDAAQEVLSPTIRRALAIEFQRLGLPDWLPDALSDSPSAPPPPAPAGPPADEIAEDVFSQGNRLSDTASDAVSPSERVVVTKGLYLEPTTHNPQPTPSVSPVATAPDALAINQRAQRITNAYHSAEPMSKWPAVNGIVIKAIKTGRWTDEAIQDALLRMAQERRSVTVDSLRIELDGFTPRSNGRSSSALVEHNGLMLKPSNIEAIERNKRMEALDAQRFHLFAIEGGAA